MGCVHEQANPTIDIPWDNEKVYDYYWRYFAWSEDMVDRNVLMRYQPFEVDFTQHDPLSIMQYPVQIDLTIGGFEIGWNTTLSETDKSFITQMYPIHGSA